MHGNNNHETTSNKRPSYSNKINLLCLFLYLDSITLVLCYPCQHLFETKAIIAFLLSQLFEICDSNVHMKGIHFQAKLNPLFIRCNNMDLPLTTIYGITFTSLFVLTCT